MLEIKDYALPSPEQWRIIIKGMRNAFKSWDKSDSYLMKVFSSHHFWMFKYMDLNNNDLDLSDDSEETEEIVEEMDDHSIRVSDTEELTFYLGDADKNLLLNLSKLGSSDRKVLRQLPITLEIKAPLYWWKQMDTYKIGTVANSESTMHTITKKEFELKDFSYDNESVPAAVEQPLMHCETANVFMEETIKHLNELRKTYLETKDKWYWQKIIEFLPESYNQTRTWTGSYESIINIILQRYEHKLPEWRAFCKWCLDNIPLVKEIIELINPEIIELYYGDER